MNFIVGLVALTAISLTVPEDGPQVSVLNNHAEPVLLDSGTVVSEPIQETVLDQPLTADMVIEDPAAAPSFEPGVAPSAPVVVGRPWIPAAPAVACESCQRSVCYCKADVTTKFELVDPQGCVHVACAKVPACCANEAPVVSWKGRLLGRQIATLCWNCCDHEIKVVISRRGKVRVRD